MRAATDAGDIRRICLIVKLIRKVELRVVFKTVSHVEIVVSGYQTALALHDSLFLAVACFCNGNILGIGAHVVLIALGAFARFLLRYDRLIAVRCARFEEAAHGEKQELRIGGYDFSKANSSEKAQNRATPVPEPEAILSKQDCPEDKIIRTLHPKEFFRKGDYAIYDIGENVSGYPVVEFDNTDIDEVISLRFAEELDGDGRTLSALGKLGGQRKPQPPDVRRSC